jgi:hypothetical protein
MKLKKVLVYKKNLKDLVDEMLHEDEIIQLKVYDDKNPDQDDLFLHGLKVDKLHLL